MKLSHVPLLAAFLAASLFHSPASAQRPDTQAVTPAQIAEGNRAFALRLYRELAREEGGNLFFSPASIALAIAPLALGAQGETLAGIQRALSLPNTGPDLPPAFGALQRSLERTDPGATVSIANALWLNRENEVRPAFLEMARTHFDATVETLDFGGDPQGSTDRINRWADTETRGRIPTIVSPDQFNRETRLLVSNAVYFLADWADPFSFGSRPAPFTLANGQRTEVPTMAQIGAFRHYRGRGFAALDLPYRDDRLVMTILLPDDADGLPALERSLTPAQLDRTLRALDRADPVPVSLSLPRFSLRSRYRLNDPLIRLGMGRAFGLEADFSGVSEEPLRISGVTHFTFLRVDERGTEAAAVTVVGIIVTSGRLYRRPPIPFRADRPFLFMLRDRESGAILFLGRLLRPE